MGFFEKIIVKMKDKEPQRFKNKPFDLYDDVLCILFKILLRKKTVFDIEVRIRLCARVRPFSVEVSYLTCIPLNQVGFCFAFLGGSDTIKIYANMFTISCVCCGSNVST